MTFNVTKVLHTFLESRFRMSPIRILQWIILTLNLHNEESMPQIKSLKPVKAINKEVTGFFIFLHLMAIPAFFPFGFSWSAVAVMLFLYWLTASIGICLGLPPLFDAP